jgi:hypothetical protein
LRHRKVCGLIVLFVIEGAKGNNMCSPSSYTDLLEMSIEKSLNFEYSLLQNIELWLHSQRKPYFVCHFTKPEISFVGNFTRHALLFRWYFLPIAQKKTCFPGAAFNNEQSGAVSVLLCGERSPMQVASGVPGGGSAPSSSARHPTFWPTSGATRRAARRRRKPG